MSKTVTKAGRGIIATDAIKETDAIAQLRQRSPELPVNPVTDSVIATDSVTSPEQSAPASSSSPEQPIHPTGELRLTADQLQAAIAVAVDAALAPVRAELQSTRDQLAASDQQNQSLEAVFKVIGTPSVMHSSARDGVSGLASDFAIACQSAPSAIWVDKRTGEQFVQRDMAQARSLFLTSRDQLRRDMDAYAKQNGFLQGGRTGSDAATLRTDVLPTMLDYLSMVMRETHRGRYVWWQFPFYDLELGKGPGDTIQVPRLRWITEPTSVGDRTLTPGVNLTTNRQPINITSKSITLAERGLGSGVPGTSQPIAIPEFLTAYSLINLENAVLKVLGHDYEVYEDLSIRVRAFASTRVIYNDRGSVTTNPLSVGANDDGTLTENFVNNAYAYASGLQIPPFDDGCYVWVIPDTAAAQLKNSLALKNQYLSVKQVEEITSILIPASNRDQGKVSGYAGSVGGFHFFSTNAHSMGAAGTEGVQLESLGTGSTLTRASFILGQAAIARAVGMEAQIRTDSVLGGSQPSWTFGRLQGFTWLSHETTDDLDVDPAIAAEQQLRVLEVHTTDIVL